MKPFHDLHKRIKQEEIKDMGLRDYFAAKAMQGFLSNAYFAKHDPMDRDYMSTLSYKLADAMMEARNV